MQIHNSNLHNNQNDSPSGRFVAPVVTGLLAQLLPVGRKSPQENHFWLSSHFVLRRSHALSNLLRRSRFMRNAAILSLFSLVLATSAVLVPIYNNMSVTEAATGTAQSSTLTLDVSNSTASVDLSVDNSNGTFVSSDSSNSISFNVSTNNYTGYKLSLSGNDNSQRLTHSSNSSYYLSSITGSVGESNFSANNATAASNYNGKWGYNLTINSGTPSDYLAAPTTTSTPLDETSSANASGSSNNYKIGIGARASYDTVAGTYTGTYILSVIANAIAYSITYADNTGDSSVTNLPSFTSGGTTTNTQSGSVSTTSITLPTTIPTRTGYTFKSWCLGTVSNNGTTCTGTAYPASTASIPSYFGIDQTTINITTLYAMWTINTYICSAEYRLQNADGTYPTTYTSAGIVNGAVAYGSTCTYTSNQSTTYYTNQTTSQTITDTTTLRVDIPRTTYTLTVNRNTSYISSVSGAGTYRWGQSISISATPSSGNKFTAWSQTAGTTSSFGSTASASTTFTMPASNATIYANGATSVTYIQDFTKSMCNSQASSAAKTVTDRRDNKTYTVRYINGSCWMTQNLRITGTISGTYSNFTASSVNISAGSLTSGNSFTEARTATSGSNAWYNYCAASAGTICTESNSTTATQDICPSGWRLPTSSEFDAITSYTSAFRPVTGGVYNSGSLGDTSRGWWWASTAGGAGDRRGLIYNGSSLSSVSSYTRYNGFYVRCLRSS